MSGLLRIHHAHILYVKLRYTGSFDITPYKHVHSANFSEKYHYDAGFSVRVRFYPEERFRSSPFVFY